MPRIPFQKPKKVEWEILSERYGRLVAEPFEKGYALTVGNSLRRTLLAIVPGAAISWIKIDGVRSADQKIPGVTENTVDVLLNFKKLAVQVPSGEPRVMPLQFSGPKVITGADIPETEVEIMNPETHLMALERAASFLKGHFSPLSTPAGEEEVDAEGASGEEYLREALGKTIEELTLPARAV